MSNDAIPPLRFAWDGEAFYPKVPKLADKYFTVGEDYSLVPHEDRSAASHRHYFASINEAHGNLPEILAERLPTPEHLRKYALIKCGFANRRDFVAPPSPRLCASRRLSSRSTTLRSCSLMAPRSQCSQPSLKARRQWARKSLPNPRTRFCGSFPK